MGTVTKKTTINIKASRKIETTTRTTKTKKMVDGLSVEAEEPLF